MNAKDLMIGDWVLDGTQNAQVTSITCGGVIETTAHEFSNIEVIEPIPLTCEILEKNWFDVMVYDNGDKLFAYGSLCILEHKGILTLKISDCRKIINHVHELQHALKLCGIEKEIEL